MSGLDDASGRLRDHLPEPTALDALTDRVAERRRQRLAFGLGSVLAIGALVIAALTVFADPVALGGGGGGVTTPVEEPAPTTTTTAGAPPELLAADCAELPANVRHDRVVTTLQQPVLGGGPDALPRGTHQLEELVSYTERGLTRGIVAVIVDAPDAVEHRSRWEPELLAGYECFRDTLVGILVAFEVGTIDEPMPAGFAYHVFYEIEEPPPLRGRFEPVDCSELPYGTPFAMSLPIVGVFEDPFYAPASEWPTWEEHLLRMLYSYADAGAADGLQAVVVGPPEPEVDARPPLTPDAVAGKECFRESENGVLYALDPGVAHAPMPEATPEEAATVTPAVLLAGGVHGSPIAEARLYGEMPILL